MSVRLVLIHSIPCYDQLVLAVYQIQGYDVAQSLKLVLTGLDQLNRSCFLFQLSAFERGRILTRAAHLLRQNLEEIALLEVKVNFFIVNI